MDSGNSGSISSSGDEEYDSSRPDHHHHHHQTLLPSTFHNQPPQFGSLSHPSLVPLHHNHVHNHNHPSFFDVSSTYFHSLSQPQPNNTNLNCFLNLETGPSQTRRSEPDCTAGASPSSSLLPPHHQVLGGSIAVAVATDPSLQLRSVVHDDNARAVSSSQANTTPRNPKKRTRASRRAPTTVLTTDTSNFRAMVQEFTGIPAPPFSGSSYSRRLDLLATSSSFRSSSTTSSSQLDTTSSFYPLRPSPQRVIQHQQNHQNHQNQLIFPSSSSSLLQSNSHMVDGSTTNNSSSNNYQQQQQQQQQLPHDLGLTAYNNNNSMLNMHNNPILGFHASQQPLHAFGIGGFGSKPLQSLEDLGVGQGHVNNAHLVATETAGGGGGDGGGRRDPLMSLDGSYGGGGGGGNGGKDDSGGGGGCKLNFSGGGSSTLNGGDKTLMENNSAGRGEGAGSGTAVDSWICSSD